jgi:nitroreductase
MEDIQIIKKAQTRNDVLDIIKKRFSPRSFRPASLTHEEINTLIEAASWAPSAMNEQPWRFVVALRSDEERFRKLADYLVPGNKAWATNAGALVLILGKRSYTMNGKANVNNTHDVGMASMNLLLQAAGMDIFGHIMEGFHKNDVSEDFDLPAQDLVPVTMLALGRLDEPDKLDEPYYSREVAGRTRKGLEELVLDLV